VHFAEKQRVGPYSNRGRLLANLYRCRSLGQAYLEALASLPEDKMPSAKSRADMLEALNEVARVLARLSIKARTAFLMSQLEGYTQKEIAEYTSETSGRVPVRMLKPSATAAD
jgi:DNA-directed RNA polymerase specialized sigma24 family protein